MGRPHSGAWLKRGNDSSMAEEALIDFRQKDGDGAQNVISEKTHQYGEHSAVFNDRSKSVLCAALTRPMCSSLIVQANYLLSLCQGYALFREKETLPALYDEQGGLTKNKSHFCEIC